MPQVALSSTGSGAASLLNGLNAAANQQATQTRLQQAAQAAQDQRDQQSLYEAMSHDWVPADAPTSVVPGSTGAHPLLNRSTPAMTGMDPSRIMTIGGKRMYHQTDADTGKAFVPTGGLGAALRAAGWDGKTPITSTQSHEWMMAVDAAAPKDEPFDIDLSGKVHDANGNPVPGVIGKKSKKFFPLDLSGGSSQGAQQPGAAPAPTPGVAADGPFDGTGRSPFDTAPQTPAPTAQTGQPPQLPAQTGSAFGTRPTLQTPNNPTDVTSDMTEGQAAQAPARGAKPDGPFTFNPREPAEKPDVSQIIPGKVGPGGGPLLLDRTKNTASEVKLPAGSKDAMTPAQTEADKDRHSREAERKDAAKMKPAEARLIVKTKADAIAKADQEYQKAIGTAITPEDHQGALDERQKGYQAAQNEYEESLSAATGNQVPHNSWADTPAKKAAPKTSQTTQPLAKPAKPAAPPASPASVTLASTQAQGGYIVGRTYRGIKYLGGDPKIQASWGR